MEAVTIVALDLAVDRVAEALEQVEALVLLVHQVKVTLGVLLRLRVLVVVVVQVR